MKQEGWTVVTHFDAPRKIGAVAQFRLFFEGQKEAGERAVAILNGGLNVSLDADGSILVVPVHRIRAVELWSGDQTQYPELEPDLRRASTKLGTYIDDHRG